MLSLGKDGMADEYMPHADAVVDGHSSICEVDLFHEQALFPCPIVSSDIAHEGSREVVIDHLVSNVFVTATIVRYGLMPCAPYQPTVAITIRALEFYRITHLHCPHVSIHSFVKTLCNLHSKALQALFILPVLQCLQLVPQYLSAG